MQTSLCLRTPGLNVRTKHHPLPLRQASSVLMRRRCQLALNFSPLFCNGLWAGPSRRLINTAVCSHMTPQEEGISKNKTEEARRALGKPTAAAVVLACTLVAMCTSWNSRAWAFQRFGSPPPVTDEAPTSTPMHAQPQAPVRAENRKAKSIQALQEIFDWKYAHGTLKPAPTPKILLEILKDELPEDDLRKLKKYYDQLENIEKREAATNSLFQEWKQRPRNLEAYNIGLVLIDLLIIQDDYKRADIVCQNIETYAPRFDVRPQICRAILDMMLLADAIESEGKETEKGRMLKRKMVSTVRKVINLMLLEESLGSPPPHV